MGNNKLAVYSSLIKIEIALYGQVVIAVFLDK